MFKERGTTADGPREVPMATHDQVADEDYQDHVESYRGFLFGIRLSVITAAVILLLMAFFLT